MLDCSGIGWGYSSRRSYSRPALIHIEDDALWTDIVGDAVRRWSEVSYRGTAATAYAGLTLCRELQPKIVLLDLRLPDMDGFALVDHLRGLASPPRILVLTSRADHATLYRAWSGKVAGLIWKSPCCLDRVKAGIETVLADRNYFPPEVLAAMRHFRSAPDAFHKLLSDRQIELLDSFVRGESDAEIAARAGLSASGVRTHRHQILTKLNLDGTPDLMRWGLEKGFGEPLRPAPPPPIDLPPVNPARPRK
jgi:DNA-binding NarL/FixJ family response regulator